MDFLVTSEDDRIYKLIEAAHEGDCNYIQQHLQGDQEYGTLIYAAAAGGHANILSLLLKMLPEEEKWCFSPALLVAVRQGRLWAVRTLIQQQVDEIACRHLRDAFDTAVELAAREGHMDIVGILLVNADNLSRDNAYLARATGTAMSAGNKEIVELLLIKMEELATDSSAEREPVPALVHAIDQGHVRVARKLIDIGSDVNHFLCEKGTALSVASKQGRADIVQLLIENGLNIRDGETKFEYYSPGICEAVTYNHIDVVQMLLESGARADGGYSCDSAYTLPLRTAAENDNEKMVKLLLRHGATPSGKQQKYQDSPLEAAIQNGNARIVEMLLNAGAEPQLAHGEDAAIIPVSDGCGEIVQLLMNKGFTFEQPFADGEVICDAAGRGLESLVRRALEAGVDPNIRSDDFSENTPLKAAAAGGHKKIVKMLLNAGSDVNLSSGKPPKTALFEASKHGRDEIVRLLLENSADVDAPLKHQKEGTPLMIASSEGHVNIVQILLESGANVNKTDRLEGMTPLMLASKNGHEAVVKTLIEAGADVDIRSKMYGATALILASGGIQQSHLRIVERLLNADANVDLARKNGATALIVASKAGYAEIVEILLNAGANLDLTCKKRTALGWAWKRNKDTVAQMLLDASCDLNRISLQNDPLEDNLLEDATHKAEKENISDWVQIEDTKQDQA